MDRARKLILCVTNDLSHDRRVQRIAASLQSEGYEVCMLGRNLPGSKELPAFPFQTHRIRCVFNNGPLFYLEFNLRLCLWLIGRRPDIITANDLDTVPGALSAAVLCSSRTAFDAHEHFCGVPELIGRPLVRSIWRMVEKYLVPKFDIHYTVAKGLAELLEERTRRPFSVVMNTPELKSNEPIQNTGDQQFILYQGALNEGRGLPELIRAMHDIDLPLKLAGGGDLEAELKALVLDEKLQDKVEFLGYLESDELDELSTKAWIGLNLLDGSSENYRLSLANKFFDYMHAGVPSINMDFPEYGTIVGQFPVGILLKDLSQQLIASAVNDLHRDKALYERMRTACLQARKTYHWNRSAETLTKLYNTIER